jgi:hypothetical protein
MSQKYRLQVYDGYFVCFLGCDTVTSDYRKRTNVLEDSQKMEQ